MFVGLLLFLSCLVLAHVVLGRIVLARISLGAGSRNPLGFADACMVCYRLAYYG